jgi:hypothetical protein
MNFKKPIHPFQYDTGISQRQRIMDDLLDGPAQLDSRTMADMLGYFVKFSRQINFYDEDMTKKDWRPFFQNSLPFIISSILNFRQDATATQLAAYQKKFVRRPSKAGLAILMNYIHTKIVQPFTGWQRQLVNSGLPIAIVLDGLIKKKLKDPCLPFMQCVNTAVKLYQLPAIDFTALFRSDTDANPWNFTVDQLTGGLDDSTVKKLGRTKRARLLALYQRIFDITTPFLQAINASTGAADISLQQSFESLRDDLKQRHQPHLALIFAFLNLFRHLQDGLNGYTKKHLDFFYRQVLAFQPKPAVPDKAFIVFAIQKQLASYTLKKGLTLKGPKDNNKADILFALDDELSVNQAQITDIRTLYVNDRPVANRSFVQGVYMAPVATKANGVDKDFPDGAPNSWPTVGARYSKYTDPESKFIHAYPNARLGFILASPVLLLNEGARTITIQLKCTWKNGYCSSDNPNPEDPTELYQQLTSALQLGLNISFSGDKDWVSPKNVSTITASPLTITESKDYTFDLTILSTLQLDEPPVTFYNKDSLKEDIDTKLPVARILLNDKIKLSLATVAEVSLYHFFRNVVVSNTSISVRVTGVKKFIVQNDESLQDVNKPVYPFGTRPTVIGFNKVAPAAPAATIAPNLIGPNFYIGSQEIFEKKWIDVRINLNWKDKPADFRDYYQAYLYDGQNFGLDEKEFQVNIAVLDKQTWLPEQTNTHTTHNTITGFENRALFDSNISPKPYDQSIVITAKDFFKIPDPQASAQGFHIDPAAPLTKLDASTQYGFIRLNLQNQDFLQKDYAYVLARQMMALGKLSGGDKSDQRLENAVYYKGADGPVVFNTNLVKKDVNASMDFTTRLAVRAKLIRSAVDFDSGDITGSNADDVRSGVYQPAADKLDMQGEINALQALTKDSSDIVNDIGNFQAIIPNEPWTPIIQGMSLDYSAEAIDTDIDLIHLYPFAGTYKKEELSRSPTLLPTFCDEGTLFLGLTGLVPGSNLNILFQLAEATADTEESPTPLQFSYLDHNTWKPLRTGFEILDDATDELSTSGIIKLAIPGNITDDNTVMPAGLSWIKVSIAGNSGIVAETIAICTQAIQATFTDADTNDRERLDTPLPANTLTRLETADASVKKIDQPYDSFGGRLSETDGYFYVRVSETLRHKGRAIQRDDYEKIALDAFPELYKAKCINHSFGLNARLYADDYPMAPGYVLLAVIPDLTKLKASASFEPRAPLSLLEQLETRMQSLTSPFVRFRAMNPRYEKVDFYLQVRLLPGKDKNYYQQRLQDDIREFMAPWSVGEFDKLRFGQVINRSDLIRFLETRDYLDYVLDWKWRHAEEEDAEKKKVPLSADPTEIFPMTPRSILIAGDIDICIEDKDALSWDKTPVTDSHNKANIYKNG